MKKLILRIFVINALMLLGLTTVWGQPTPSPIMRYKLDYDFCSNEYVAKVIPTVSLTNQIINTSSQYTIVLPGNEVGNIITTNGGTASWSTGVFQVLYYPIATPPATYRFWYPLGSLPINLPANVEYELFRFRYGSGTCLPGLRLYINGTDVFDGIFDFNNYFVLNNSSDDFYLDNVSNASPSCLQYDFGDLTSLWGSPKAGMISPDCNADGIPDNTILGAVWAGNIIDAETVQKFSSQTTLANGDNVDGLNDEDGLTVPSTPLNLGTSYTFNVRLNSNQTGKQVFYGLWFDWNNDGNFNNDNATGTGPAFYSGNGTTSSPVDLPVVVLTPSAGGNGAGQANPNYKIRLIASDVAVTSGMFSGTFNNGEVEDYAAPITILPVTFSNVTAEAKNCNIYLSFDYLTQQNNKEFRIEYSSTGTSWQELALLPNVGNNGSQAYSYVHSTPSAGVNYYRIKQVDFNGIASYSKIASTLSSCGGKIVSYPNPVHASLTVVLPLNIGKSQLRITDATGKLVISTLTQSSYNNINTQMLSNGLYLLEVLNAEKIVYSTKFVKQ